MDYKYFNDLFNTRKKGRDYKVFHQYRALCKDENDNLLVTGTTWNYPVTKVNGENRTKAERVLARDRVYATISPDSVMTLMRDVADQGVYNLFNKLIACAYLECDNNTYSRTAKYRILKRGSKASVTKWDVPAVKGLQINLATGTIVTAPADMKKVTDRKAAAPIYKRVDEVVKLMTVLRRMGDINDVDLKGWGNYTALMKVDKSMDDANIVALAEAAYRKAKSTTSGTPEAFDGATRTWVPSVEQAANFEKRLIANARRHLTRVLKEEHGGFALVPK